MITLYLRTDQPEAEITIFDDNHQMDRHRWLAHRTLARDIHRVIETRLSTVGKGWSDLGAVVVYRGPGSFTGLRIAASVVNAMAATLQIPVIGETSEQWQERARVRLAKGENDRLVLPEYGQPPRITTPRK